MSCQTMYPNDDYFTHGLLRVRYNNQLKKGDGDVDVIHRYSPGHVPSTQFPGNRTIFFGGTVFDLGAYGNIYTVIPLSKWSDDKRGLDVIIKYIILTIQQQVPPSIANAMGVKVYLYTENQVSIPGFDAVIRRSDTVLCHRLSSERYEYVSTLMFDNDYNTPFVKCYDLDNFYTPSWTEELHSRPVGVSFSPRGFEFEPVVKLT